MANRLFVAEFERPRNQWVNIANAAPIAEQVVAIGGSSTLSTVFGTAGKTAMIRVHADSICSIVIGGSGATATTSNMRMPADSTEYFSVQPNQYIAVISNT